MLRLLLGHLQLVFLLFHLLLDRVELVLSDIPASKRQLCALLFLLEKSIHEVDVLDLKLRELDAFDEAL